MSSPQLGQSSGVAVASPTTLQSPRFLQQQSMITSPKPTLFDWIKEHLLFMNNSTPYKINISNMGKSNRKQLNFDRFQLEIPVFCIGECSLSIHLFYDGSRPHSPFDFQIISDLSSSYLQNFMIDSSKLQSMIEWRDLYIRYLQHHDVSKELCTFTFRTISEIIEFLTEYYKLVISKHKNDNIRFEFDTTQSIGGANFYIKELYSNDGTECSTEKIYFLVPLSISGLEKIEEYQRLFDVNTIQLPDSKPKLLVVYSYDKSRDVIVNVNTEIIYPTSVKNSKRLQWLTQIPIPSWNQGKSCIIEYMLEAVENIESEVEKYTQKLKARLEFIKQLLAAFGNPTDFSENESLTKISFLMERDKFQFFLHITLEREGFPIVQPVIRMQSTQYFKSSDRVKDKLLPVRVRVQQLNWTEGGSAEVMTKNVEQIRIQVLALLGEFIKVCQSEGTSQ
ncbi:predicted protein [Naegleria gruberi]|uniref:BRISC and BRCA1-A complex member 2 n=1 Tax=Naegleria gruberi TaxID=5762 RepID=D2VLA1_NAEGR|nr:uncharacterized protein NAEGRDRAFT_69708 [Naegleria gruberi]EFC42275.1 predicted protein [Naegleria gruberi]|eukprot:XP_002675019.1 predicted protein [Naegleria gruberi strain NEG-M]